MLKDKVYEMISVEKKYAEELRSISSSIKHPVLQSLFMGIALDSDKHSIFYESIYRLLTAAQPLLSMDEFDMVNMVVDNHIRMEENMIVFVKNVLGETSDPRLKLLLEAIYEDEVKHHKLLMVLKKMISEKEVLSEDHLWDMVWKESPWHGTPGG